jgi:general secretion pathway protein J
MAMKLRTQTGGAEGFTLVELLVAITIVALLTVVLFGGLRLGSRASNAVSLQIDRSSKITVVYDFMQRELTDARPLTTAESAPQSTVAFDGEAGEITFATIPPAYLSLGGFHLLHLALDDAGGQGRLMVSWQQIPRGATPSDAAPLRPSILLDHVRRAEFAYFGQPDVNLPSQWLEQWTTRDKLPQLVRLRLVMTDGWHAPDLVVALRQSAPASQ